MSLSHSEIRAVSIWHRFSRRVDLDDLKGQAALLFIQGKRDRALWCDLFDYAEYEYRRRPFARPRNDPAYSWTPLHYHVRRAVDRLPVRQRCVIRLVFFEDYRKTDAAKEMRITKGGVTHLIGKALRNLRREIVCR